MRILVVDDNQDARDLTEAVLLSAGYKDVLTAASAWEAFKALDIGRSGIDKPSVDLILLDIVMPEMDGIEACARIRNDPRHADTPIIMVTSLADMDNLANAFVAGANDYITKPVNRIELVARVRAALKLKSELERRLARERELLSFLSSWGERRANVWIDERTGLFVGDVVEAYLIASRGHSDLISVLAITLDRFDTFCAAHGEGAGTKVLQEIAHVVRSLAGTVGMVAGIYRNNMIILIAPDTDSATANRLAETLRTAVAKLRIQNSEAIERDYFTASVATITGRGGSEIERAHLLTRTISASQAAAEGHGDRVLEVAV